VRNALLFCLLFVLALVGFAQTAVITPTTQGGSVIDTQGTVVLNFNKWYAGPATYTDSFTRANGSLGSNWAEPSGANGTLQILSDLVYAQTSGVVHSAEIYTPGTFSNNQYSIITLKSGTGSATSGTAGQFSLVRGATATARFYNDAVATGSTFGGLLYRVGDQNSVDFCGTAWAGPAYVVGDTHELDVAGSGPVFFWSKHNGTVDATCSDVVDNYTGGQPGLGVIDPNGSPFLSLGTWTGGSLSSFSTTPSDNFQRANAGWLGVNWWFAPTGGNGSGATGSYFVLSGNAAVLSVPTNQGTAIWTTAFGSTQASKVTTGNIASGDWVAAVARYTLPPNGTSSANTDSYYFVLVEGNGTVDLFAKTNADNLLASLGTFSGTVSTIELDASGTSPVSLVVKINGTQFGSTFSDSTYKLTGAYEGFSTFGTTASTVTGWTGN
jgi:hypothetical protein